MKRITAITAALLAFVLIFSGCNTLIKDRVTAYSLVKNALEMTGGLKDAELKLTEEIHAQTTGLTLDVPVVYDLKFRDYNGENPVGVGVMHMDALAQKMELAFCFDRDYLYLDMDGAKLKLRKDSPDAALYMDYDPEKLLKQLPEETLEGVVVTLNEDGSKTVSADVSEEVFAALYKEITQDLEEKAVDDVLGDSGASFEMSNYHVDITVLENGYLGAYSLSFSGDMTLGEEALLNDEPVTIRYRMKATVEFIDPGKEVQVILPADLDEYMEYDEYYEKYPYGPDWEYNEETGKYTYVGEDGDWLYDEEKDDWYTEEYGERFYFNEDMNYFFYGPDWEYDEETDKYTYVGEDGDWLYDGEKEDWYCELDDGQRYYFNEEMNFPFYDGDDWLYDEETDAFTYVGDDENWLYDERAEDWYYQQEDGKRHYFYYGGELFYNGETGKYVYIGTYGDWHYDEEHKEWYRGDRDAWFSENAGANS